MSADGCEEDMHDQVGFDVSFFFNHNDCFRSNRPNQLKIYTKY